MKVLLLFSKGVSLQHWNDLGIIEREIFLYKKLQKKGIKFTFFTYGNDKDFKFSNQLEGINILPISDLIRSRYTIIKFIRFIFLPIKLKSLLKKIDIIKTNQVSGCWIGIFAKILYKRKLIVRAGYEWLSNYMDSYKISSSKNYLLYLLNYSYIYITEFIAYKLADRIIITNKASIDFIIKTFKLKRKQKKIIFLTNFIDTNLFKPLNIEKKDKYLLYIGRLSLEKNLFNLLLAVKELKGFTLNIIGTGPDEKALRNKAKELKVNVNFLGGFQNNKIPMIINKCQIYILPSFYECNPKSLLEAMSCGIPCIGTNVRGINEIISHKENGFLCKTSSNSIKKAIKYLYNNKSLRMEIGKNARSFIEENCSLDYIVDKEYNIYKEILRKGNN
jgi:glycosyltransferase involved in cell wall biosynthesis